jgi:hypothetical protein
MVSTTPCVSTFLAVLLLLQPCLAIDITDESASAIDFPAAAAWDGEPKIGRPPPPPLLAEPCAALPPSPPAKAGSPNIILVLCDDMDLALGGFTPMTKTAKLLSDTGATASNYFIHTPICCVRATHH